MITVSRSQSSKDAESTAIRIRMSVQVDAERDRRLLAGMVFQGVRYQTRPQDVENIAGETTSALAAIVAGAQPGDLRWADPDNDFVWIAEDNSLIPMDAQTMFRLGQSLMAHRSRHIFAARSLKNSDPIAPDFTDDSYWPA